MTARTLRLVHTSDVHLGDGRRGDTPRRALRAVVAAANAAAASVLLIAGDFFDNARVDDEIVADAAAILERFAGTPIVLPGNHDAHDERSVYRRPVWRRRARHVHVLGDEPAHFAELGLEVWGRPVVEHTPHFQPLGAIPPRHPTYVRVVAGHGHVVLDQRSQREWRRSSPIELDEIAAADCEYVALGHWDIHTDVSHGGTTAFYSGAPYSLEGRLTHALLVRLRRGAATEVERLPLVDDPHPHRG